MEFSKFGHAPTYKRFKIILKFTQQPGGQSDMV